MPQATDEDNAKVPASKGAERVHPDHLRVWLDRIDRRREALRPNPGKEGRSDV